MSSKQRERNVLLTSEDSAKRASQKPWRMTWLGIGGSLLILVIVLLIDRPTDETRFGEQADIIELIGPRNLDTNRGDGIADMVDPRMGLDLPRGGWIQVADSDGRLAQQYRCQHLDPDPVELDAFWIEMEKPEVELYMSRNRLVTLSGDTALAYAPHRALEEGQFNGNVRIEMYDPVDGKPADPLVDSPALVIRTPRATFDNFLGKIACEGRIELETPREEMAGRDLQILLNDQDQRIEYLRMAKLDFLRIHSTAQPLIARRPVRGQLVRRQLPPTTATATDTDTPSFYRLTLHDGVRIRQGEGPTARSAIGEQLHLTFSLESEQLEQPTASSMHPSVVYSTAPSSLPAMAIAMTLGTTTTIEEASDIVVTCGGEVTMVPIIDSSEHLEDPRDARLDLLGSPVRIEDPQRRLRITCPQVQYHTLAKRFDLLGDDTTGVDLLTDRFRAEGSWMWARPEAGQAGFLNPGLIEVVAGSPLVQAVQAEAENEQHLTGTAMDSIEEEGDSSAVQLKMTWQGGVDIEFDPDDPAGGGPDGDPALRSILFRDEVAVRSEDGTIDCGSLRMNFIRGEDGGSEPERMVALENVRARNDDQTLWTDQLIVTMEALPDDAPPRNRAGEDDLLGGRVDVKDFLATGDVQVLLADGGRAFADRLEGDARQEIAVLTGDNVTIARKEMLIDHGRKLVISRLEGTANWDGPGEARLLRYPVEVSADRRIERPAIPTKPPAAEGDDRRAEDEGNRGPITMRARWNEQMVYDSRHNDGAGSLELRGKVAVVADGSPIERSSMDGESLTLQFAFAPEPTPTSRVEEPTEAANDTTRNPLDIAGLEQESRVLQTLIAKGDARLEYREWMTSKREDIPRVFYIAAKHITWDDLEVQAEVIGDGSLVIREPERPGEAPQPEGPFAGAGTTRFVWTKRLDMERKPGDRYEISMLGDVEGIYKGATDDDIATVTANRVDAMTKRASVSQSVSQDVAEPGPLDFQGDMEIERLRAEGTVYLATPRRRADAHIVDYDTRTQLATLTARPGRKVSIVTEGSPLPVKASRMVWNMDPRIDSIQLLEPSGTGVR
ncbi:MAG: hypothetical protein VX527_06790 [Planctomycetota bacterium]|nr:hypothetical protein [Planctomycetota bacterium]